MYICQDLKENGPSSHSHREVNMRPHVKPAQSSKGLAINYGKGGYKTGGGCEGQVKFYPYRKEGGGGEMLKGWGTKSFEVVLTQELEVLAIVMGGGRKKFPPSKGGGRKKFYPVLRGVQKVSDPRFSHFVAPPLPIINDQSLNGTNHVFSIH